MPRPAIEPVHVQALIALRTVEGLDIAVVGRLGCHRSGARACARWRQQLPWVPGPCLHACTEDDGVGLERDQRGHVERAAELGVAATADRAAATHRSVCIPYRILSVAASVAIRIASYLPIACGKARTKRSPQMFGSARPEATRARDADPITQCRTDPQPRFPTNPLRKASDP